MGLISLELACVLDRTQDHVRAEIEEMFQDVLQAREKNE